MTWRWQVTVSNQDPIKFHSGESSAYSGEPLARSHKFAQVRAISHEFAAEDSSPRILPKKEMQINPFHLTVPAI